MRRCRLALVLTLVGGCGDSDGSAAEDTDTDTDGSTSMGTTAPSTTTPPSTTAPPTSSSTTTAQTGDSSSSSSGSDTDGLCVDNDECDDPTPFCAPTGLCVECVEDEDCPSGDCMEGAYECAPVGEIAVVVGYGTRRVWSPDGVDWRDFQEVDPMGGDDVNLLRGVGYGDGTFVAVGGAGMGITITSRNGADWENEWTGATSFLSDVVWMNDTFVAAGGNGLRLRSVDGGVTWSDPPGFFSGHFRGIATDGELAVAVGNTYGSEDIGLWSSTTDGETWTDVVTGGATLADIEFGNGVFVAVGDMARVSTTTDGDTWTDMTVGEGSYFDIAFADGQFLINAEGGLWSSADGETWEEIVTPMPRQIVGGFQGGYFSFTWPAMIERTEDFVDYETVFSPQGSGLTDMAVGLPGN